MSVPFATVPTYTDRPALSEELEEKLGRTCGTGLAHAVAVVGLGGTGKTQLVLHYLETHEAEYDTVLWIDVRTKETARSSYERCCRALGLPVGNSPGEGLLQESSHVQAALVWLRSRTDDKKWLAVMDNADDLSWDVSSIIPKGKAGTVIVTSQDAQASRLQGGRTSTVKVDAMSLEEAVCLMVKHFDKPISPGDDYWDLIQEITELLDRLALPMELAGARISVDAETWGDLGTALRQYLSDYQRNQDKLLQDDEFASASPYKKTAWTAWETSLSSLRKTEDARSDIHPIKLLSFLALFDRANVQDELFRLASGGLDKACDHLETTIPTWLRGLLAKDDDYLWNDFSYRETIKFLLRYGLIRPVVGPWRGITMHGIVQRRARHELPDGYWQWYMAFLYAICLSMNDEPDARIFRRHFVLHLPGVQALLDGRMFMPSEALSSRLWGVVGGVWSQEGRFSEATQLQVPAVEAMIENLGEADSETLGAMDDLSRTFWEQGLWKEADTLNSRIIHQRERLLGTKHPLTLKKRHDRAMVMAEQGQWDDAVVENLAILEIRKEVLGVSHADTFKSMENLAIAYSKQGNLSMAEHLQVEVLEARKKSPVRNDANVLASMTNLAIIYSKQGRHGEAEALGVEVLEQENQVLGSNHPATVRSMGHLAITYWGQERYQEAEKIEVEVVKKQKQYLGSDHPNTLRSMSNLASIYRMQRRLREAEELQVEAMTALSNILGEEHPDTLGVISNLAETLLHQERWKEAEDLLVNLMDASSRVLGPNHHQTLHAMENLAYIRRCLGQNDCALVMMRRCAAASMEVLGPDHPMSKCSHEKVAEWSAIDGDTGEGVEGGLVQSTRSS